MASRARGFFGFADAIDYATSLLPHTAHAGAFVFDFDHVLHFADGPVLRDRGYTPEQVVGRAAGDVLPRVVWADLKLNCDRSLSGESFVAQYEDTNKRSYRVHGYPVLGPDGSVHGGFLVVHEAVSPAEERLSQRLREQAAIAEFGRVALERGASVEELIREGSRLVVETLARVDAAGVGELLPGGQHFRAHEMGGRELPVAGSLLGQAVAAGKPIVSQAELPSHLREAGFQGGATVPIGPPNAPFGALGAFSREAAAFSQDDLHFLSAITNVIAQGVGRAQADAELRRTALHDLVTGLPNRQLLDDRLEQSLRFADRADLRVGVLFVDLDRFKVVNDSLGHHAGDEVLRAVATRLQSAVRASDTVARFGGDEFVIVAPGLETDRDAVQLAQTVLRVLDAPISVGDRSIHMQASVGIAIGDPKRQQAPRDLLRDADAAMYRAKAKGRHRYEFCDPAATDVVDALQVEQALREALDGRQLRLAFQPFIDLEDSSTFGAEVLLRWQHPTKMLVGPEVFLDVAEQTGLIVPIGEWMLHEACARAARWHKRDDFLLTINLSATQLADRGLVEAVRGALESTGMRPQSLGLELTEQVLVVDEDATLATLTELKALGVKLLLDDFGTGYSSLSHLKRFPVDIVKIDRSFIHGLDSGDDGSGAALVSAIVGMSWATHKEVIGEGVETAEQSDGLRRVGCGIGQGYFFAKPLPADEFEAWMKDFESRKLAPAAAPIAATAATMSLTDFQASAQRVLTRLTYQLPDDVGLWIGHLDHDMTTLRVIAAAGDSSYELEPGLESPLEQSLSHALADGRGPELSGNAAGTAYGDLHVQRALEVRSFVGQPIVADGRIVAALCAISRQPDAFNTEHLDWLAMGSLVLSATLQAAGHRGTKLHQHLRRAAVQLST